MIHVQLYTAFGWNIDDAYLRSWFLGNHGVVGYAEQLGKASTQI